MAQNLQILKDEKKRAAFDEYGHASQQPGFDPNAFSHGSFAGGFPGFDAFTAAFGKGGRQSGNEFFEHLFGFGSSQSHGRASRGDDIEAQVTLSFLDACKGVTRTINISPLTNCSTCSGTGIRPGAKRSTCGACGGSGTRTFVIDSGFQMASTCGTCEGTGYVVHRKDQCVTCMGVGTVKSKKSVNVTIPPGNTTSSVSPDLICLLFFFV